MNNHRAPSRTARLGLGLALLMSLWPQPALAVLPDDCSPFAYTPIRPKRGEVIAKGDNNCTTPRLMRLTVKLQRLVDGDWRTRAVSIGESTEPITYLKVVASIPCRTGKYRTRVAVSLRDAITDPWVVAIRFNSPRRAVKICPRSPAP